MKMMEQTQIELHPPALHDIAAVLQRELGKKYTTASSTVVKCPDLRQAPFNLASEGLCGSEVTADIGGQALEHTHCFNERNEGGHYHYGLDAGEVEYEGYFNVARTFLQIYKP